MKVKVTYTVNYDDVPSLVANLVENCRDKLKRCSNFKFDFFRTEHVEQDIQKVRDELDVISEQLQDCMNLCKGYVSALPAEEEQFSTAHHMEKIAELERQIADIETLNNQNEAYNEAEE